MSLPGTIAYRSPDSAAVPALARSITIQFSTPSVRVRTYPAEIVQYRRRPPTNVSLVQYGQIGFDVVGIVSQNLPLKRSSVFLGFNSIDISDENIDF